MISEDPGMEWGAYLSLSISQFDYFLRCPLISPVEYIHSAFHWLVKFPKKKKHANEPVLPHDPVAIHPACLKVRWWELCPPSAAVTMAAYAASPPSLRLVLLWKEPMKSTLFYSDNTCSKQKGDVRPTSFPRHSGAAVSSSFVDLGNKSM